MGSGQGSIEAWRNVIPTFPTVKRSFDGRQMEERARPRPRQTDDMRSPSGTSLLRKTPSLPPSLPLLRLPFQQAAVECLAEGKGRDASTRDFENAIASAALTRFLNDFIETLDDLADELVTSDGCHAQNTKCCRVESGDDRAPAANRFERTLRLVDLSALL